MKKFFTLIAAFAAFIGGVNAQSTITWNLTEEGANQLKGEASDAEITVSGVTAGSNITIRGIKSYTEGDITYKGTLFSPTTDLKENKSAKTDGTNLVNFKFNIPTGFSFTPTNVSFYCAKDGSGNDHFADVDLIAGSTKITVKSKSVFGRGGQGSAPQNYTVTTEDQLQGDVTLQFNLYGKVTDGSKGWVLGNVVVSGELIDLSDPRKKAPISWDKGSVTLKLRDPFTAPVLSNNESLPVTFTSSNETVAKVSEAGVITLEEGATGTALITATYDGSNKDTATYKTTSVSTTITVNTNVIDVNVVESYENDPKEIKTDFIWKAPNNSSLDPTTLVDDKNIEMHTVYTASGASSSYNRTYLGYEFNGGVQIGRVKDKPSDEVKDGGKQDGSSALIVTPKKDLQLVMFFRRQSVEQRTADSDDVEKNEITRTHYYGLSANDGKSVFASPHSDIEKKLDQTVVFGLAYDVDYLACAAIWDLKAGETYTLWASNTTIATHGIGYTLRPEIPEAKVDGITDLEDGISLKDEETAVVTFTTTDEGHKVYAAFVAEKNEGIVPAEETEGMTHKDLEGVTFEIVGENGITVSETGTLHYFAHNPNNGLKSELGKISVTKSSAIDGIATDANAPVEYYNLQGVRVANPENGIYIRRQGKNVTKVMVK